MLHDVTPVKAFSIQLMFGGRQFPVYATCMAVDCSRVCAALHVLDEEDDVPMYVCHQPNFAERIHLVSLRLFWAMTEWTSLYPTESSWTAPTSTVEIRMPLETYPNYRLWFRPATPATGRRPSPGT